MTNWTTLRDSISDLDVPPAVRTRLRTLLGMYEALGYDKFESFLSESSDDEGNRRFESLWLFNDQATMEAQISDSEGDYLDGAPINGRIVRWVLRARNYDFQRATQESRLSAELWYTDDVWGELNATGANCDRLRALIARFVIPQTNPT